MATIRDVVVDILRKQDMRTIFGNPGTTELPFLADLPDDFTYVLALNEAAATAMADGYAAAARRPTLVNLHSTAGLGNAMGSLINAAAAHSPVVALVGQQSRTLMGTPAILANHHAQTLPLGACKFIIEPARAQDVPAALTQAIHMAAQAPAGPVCVSVPMDDWQQQYQGDPHTNKALNRTVAGDAVPNSTAITALSARITAAHNPVLVVGHEMDTPLGYITATALAQRLGAPVWLSGYEPRCGFPTRHPAFRGVLPPDIPSTVKILAEHDLVIMLGCVAFNIILHKQGSELAIGCDLVGVTADPLAATRSMAGDYYIGAPDAAAAMLLGHIPDLGHPPQSKADRTTPQASRQPGRMTADEIFDTIGDLIPHDAIVVNEALRQLPQMWARVPINQPGSFFSAGSVGLGYALPAAIGIHMAQPQRPILAVIGDGSLQYTIQALWTAAQYRTPITILILANQEYAILKDWSTMTGIGPIPGLDIPGLDSAAIAQAYGIPATRVTTRTALQNALAGAWLQPGLQLIEAALETSLHQPAIDTARPADRSVLVPL